MPLYQQVYPVLKDELIPVIIADDGTVTYANIENKWYDYETKEWANSVILEDGASYNVGDVILEEDIESYFVWIPKYSYKLWDLGAYDNLTNIDKKKIHSIDIIFGTKNTLDANQGECTTPLISSKSENCVVGDYMTHPAFITLGVDGIWVGKFETGYKDAKNGEEAKVNEEDSSKVVIKPNVYSWRNSIVANMFNTAYNYNRNLDSHMMKNTEWGAVAYLSHSKYGINTEVNINNNSDYLTGFSAAEGTDQSGFPGTYGTDETITLPYNTPTGYKASTTGNITGVYDMSGGASEYVAGYLDGKDEIGGLNVKNYSSKYFDVYNASSDTITYQYRILGDATGEMGPFENYADSDGKNRYHTSWYDDGAEFIDFSHPHPWFVRGNYFSNGAISGMFSFGPGFGGTYIGVSSRLVLAV